MAAPGYYKTHRTMTPPPYHCYHLLCLALATHRTRKNGKYLPAFFIPRRHPVLGTRGFLRYPSPRTHRPSRPGMYLLPRSPQAFLIADLPFSRSHPPGSLMSSPSVAEAQATSNLYLMIPTPPPTPKELSTVSSLRTSPRRMLLSCVFASLCYILPSHI